MEFWTIFFNLCREKGKAPNNVAKDLGISSASITWWKKGERNPSQKALKAIADYFGVSVGYLLGYETEKTPSLESVSNVGGVYDKNIHNIPVFESASAGFGVMAIDQIVDYEPLYIPSEAEARETICIRVKGDSMYPKIEDGDLIQVHKQTSIDSGSIAVVMIDGEEALVKKVVYGDTWIELISINPMYKTMRFNGADVLRVRVLGLVKKIIKIC